MRSNTSLLGRIFLWIASKMLEMNYNLKENLKL